MLKITRYLLRFLVLARTVPGSIHYAPAYSNTVYSKRLHCCCNGQFYGVTDRSNRAVTVTGGPFWTNPLHHSFHRRGLWDKKKLKEIKANKFLTVDDGSVNPLCKIGEHSL